MRLVSRSILLASAALISLASCSKTDSVESTAGEFLSSIKDSNYDKAYELTSPTLQKVTSKDQLKGFTSTIGLVGYREVKWYGHVTMDSSAYVEGLIVSKDSTKIPIKIHLNEFGGVWKVSGMEHTPGFGLAGNISTGFPSDATVRTVVANAITMLDRAVKSKDFTEFYASMSRVGQSNTSKDLLAQGFKQFTDQNINVAAALNAQALVVPYLSGDVPNQPRILLVESVFQTQPVGMSVTMKFTPDGGQWKLVSMNINLLPAKAA